MHLRKLADHLCWLHLQLKVLLGGTDAYPMLRHLCSDYEAKTPCTINQVCRVLSVHEIAWTETF